MIPLYELLHVANKTPKRLLISIPAQDGNAMKESGIVLSMVTEDSLQAFALNSGGISDFIHALSHARDELLLMRLVALNRKYNKSEVKK